MGNKNATAGTSTSADTLSQAEVDQVLEKRLHKALFGYKEGTFRKSDAPDQPIYRHAPRVVLIGHPLLNMQRIATSLVLNSEMNMFTCSSGTATSSGDHGTMHCLIEQVWLSIFTNLGTLREPRADGKYASDNALAEIIASNCQRRVEQLCARMRFCDQGARVNDALMYSTLMDTPIARKLARDRIAYTRELNRADDFYDEDDLVEGDLSPVVVGDDAIAAAATTTDALLPSQRPLFAVVEERDFVASGSRVFNTNAPSMLGIPQVEVFASDFSEDIAVLGNEIHSLAASVHPTLRAIIESQRRVERMLVRDNYTADNTLYVFVALSNTYTQWILVVISECISRIRNDLPVEVYHGIIRQFVAIITRAQVYLGGALQSGNDTALDASKKRYKHALVFHFDDIPDLQIGAVDHMNDVFPSTMFSRFFDAYEPLFRVAIEKKLLQMAERHQSMDEHGESGDDGGTGGSSSVITSFSSTNNNETEQSVGAYVEQQRQQNFQTWTAANGCVAAARESGDWTFITLQEPDVYKRQGSDGTTERKKEALAIRFGHAFGINYDTGAYYRLLSGATSLNTPPVVRHARFDMTTTTTPAAAAAATLPPRARPALKSHSTNGAASKSGTNGLFISSYGTLNGHIQKPAAQAAVVAAEAADAFSNLDLSSLLVEEDGDYDDDTK